MKFQGMFQCFILNRYCRGLPFVCSRPTIVFGADVVHPPSMDVDSPSIVGMVASMDIQGARFASRTSKQGSKVEVINDMTRMVTGISSLKLDYINLFL